MSGKKKERDNDEKKKQNKTKKKQKRKSKKFDKLKVLFHDRDRSSVIKVISHFAPIFIFHEVYSHLVTLKKYLHCENFFKANAIERAIVYDYILFCPGKAFQ